MTIWHRVKRMMTAQAHGAVDEMEDPTQMLDQLVRERAASVTQTRRALCKAKAWMTQIEDRICEEGAKAKRFGEIASQALKDDREDVARDAIQRKQKAESDREMLHEQLNRTEKLTIKHRKILERLEDELESLRDRRRNLKQRIWLSEGMRHLTPPGIGEGETHHEVLARIEERTIVVEAETTALYDDEMTTQDDLENYMKNHSVDEELALLKGAISS